MKQPKKQPGQLIYPVNESEIKQGLIMLMKKVSGIEVLPEEISFDMADSVISGKITHEVNASVPEQSEF